MALAKNVLRYRAVLDVADRTRERCVEANSRRSFFGAIVFRATDISRVSDLAAPIPEIRTGTSEHSLAVLLPSLDTLLEFRSDR